jgi:ABC-type phosphate transport system substrate-binding protein
MYFPSPVSGGRGPFRQQSCVFRHPENHFTAAQKSKYIIKISVTAWSQPFLSKNMTTGKITVFQRAASEKTGEYWRTELKKEYKQL